MAAPKLKFYFREPNIDLNIPITDGTVKIGGFEREFVPNGDEADAWDCGFAARVRAHEQGAARISIPAFPNRKFRLAYIFVNSKAGIAACLRVEYISGEPSRRKTFEVWAFNDSLVRGAVSLFPLGAVKQAIYPRRACGLQRPGS